MMVRGHLNVYGCEVCNVDIYHLIYDIKLPLWKDAVLINILHDFFQ